MNEVTARLHELSIVPVVAVKRAADSTPLGDALVEGGLPCVEVTFRTQAAAEAIERLSTRGDLLVGAGTVLSIEQVKAARDAGARFIVSPGFSPKVVSYCVQNHLTITPGVCTPSDIEIALEYGLDVLKFFPAEAFGGLKTLKALSGPYDGVKFIPTGGIHPGNLADYLSFPSVLACGGTWLAKSSLISEGKFDEILANIKEAVKIAAECGRPGLQGSRPES
jgi:2-dehydro-3-deoxyphosphogluconate aldolase/(4S)-4-hydroxy-2-oxoglutarate aldolase